MQCWDFCTCWLSRSWKNDMFFVWNFRENAWNVNMKFIISGFGKQNFCWPLFLIVCHGAGKMICFLFEILERMHGMLIWILLFQVSGNDISADPFFRSFVSTSYAEMGQCTGGLGTYVPQRWNIFTRTWWKFVLQTPWSPATHEGYSSRLAYRGEFDQEFGF